MEVVIQRDSSAVATFVADAIDRLVSSKPDAVLGLATGSSSLGVYSELVRRHRAGTLAFGRATAFLLDEYIGLPPGHPESYRAFIERHFSGLVDIDPGNVHVPDGTASDVNAACAAYEAQIRTALGVDLQLLGIGADGHLGFNEPTSSLASRTRVKTLGADKAEPIARAVEGPVASMCPASAIQLHPHTTVVVDEAAAARLTLTDYYRATFAAKPL